MAKLHLVFLFEKYLCCESGFINEVLEVSLWIKFWMLDNQTYKSNSIPTEEGITLCCMCQKIRMADKFSSHFSASFL